MHLGTRFEWHVAHLVGWLLVTPTQALALQQAEVQEFLHCLQAAACAAAALALLDMQALLALGLDALHPASCTSNDTWILYFTDSLCDPSNLLGLQPYCAVPDLGMIKW